MRTVLDCLADNNATGNVRRITKEQAFLVGIGYPLQSGWKELCGGIYLNEQQEKEFHKYNIENRKKQSNAIIPFNQRGTHACGIDFYTSPAWRKVRYEALKIHGGRCMCCGRSKREHNIVLHVDHVIPRSIDKSLELDVNNLQVLCEDCNLGKSNRDKLHWGEMAGTPKNIKGLLLQRRKYLLDRIKLLDEQIILL